MSDRLDPAQLAPLVKEASDEQLADALKQMGTDTVLKEIFSGMEERFLAQRASGVNSTIQYDINADEGTKTWWVKFADGQCTTGEGPAQDPRLTLALSLPDFVKLIFGVADGTQLFMSGKLKLQGDVMFALQMQNFFDRNF